MSLRLLEPPLGADALERPTREAVAAMWAAAARQPIPDYDTATLRQFLRAWRQRRG